MADDASQRASVFWSWARALMILPALLCLITGARESEALDRQGEIAEAFTDKAAEVSGLDINLTGGASTGNFDKSALVNMPIELNNPSQVAALVNASALFRDNANRAQQIMIALFAAGFASAGVAVLGFKGLGEAAAS